MQGGGGVFVRVEDGDRNKEQRKVGKNIWCRRLGMGLGTRA